jgi:hypothetical protein
MRKRIGIYGASDEALALIPLLSANPAVEISAIVDPDALALLERLPHLRPGSPRCSSRRSPTIRRRCSATRRCTR